MFVLLVPWVQPLSTTAWLVPLVPSPAICARGAVLPVIHPLRRSRLTGSPQFPSRAAPSVLICDVGETLPSCPPLPDPATLKIDPGPLEATSPPSASMPRVGTALLTPSSSEPLEQNTTDWVT